MANKTLVKAGTSTKNYYRTMNSALKSLNGEYRMLHYPMFKNYDDDFIKAQENLTDYCISKLPDLKDKKVLEVGCGNGVQALYIHTVFTPGKTIGIDLNSDNIEIANNLKSKLPTNNIEFLVDNAQSLANIESNSVDCLVNIESAFHYPDKQEFLKQVQRVLKPGGHFVIADILRKNSKTVATKSWKNKMQFHHWSKEEYDKAFSNVDLKLEEEDDITDSVIKGYKNVSSFWAGKEGLNFISKSLLFVFFKINVIMNVRLLRKKRQYMVFSGTKS
ncbi:MAG: methyltransferase domain-containing protein [Bacteroidales bacterium]|nr:methyltransferase domain-containing protein [Bacteroidales bacterium]MBN2818723.1 methyltransferase domain-containing protein [Bacteroidales bacterium]